jgi:hypothetical protein
MDPQKPATAQETKEALRSLDTFQSSVLSAYITELKYQRSLNYQTSLLALAKTNALVALLRYVLKALQMFAAMLLYSPLYVVTDPVNL